jgi:hypothetical protein
MFVEIVGSVGSVEIVLIVWSVLAFGVGGALQSSFFELRPDTSLRGGGTEGI